MTFPEQSHRARFPGHDAKGGPCTCIVYRLTDVDQHWQVVRVVVITPDSTERGAVALSPTRAVELANALNEAAGLLNGDDAGADQST